MVEWNLLGNPIIGDISDESGYSVAINSTGSRIAIGSKLFNNGGISNVGCVKIYDLDGQTWIQKGQTIIGNHENSEFGHDVSFNSTGTRIAISSINNNGSGILRGLTRIYDLIGTTWQQVGGDINGDVNFEYSGSSISLNSDGTVIAIGAFGNNSVRGNVKIYQLLGGNWSKIYQFNSDSTVAYNGFSIEINSTGNRVFFITKYLGNNNVIDFRCHEYSLSTSTSNRLGVPIIFNNIISYDISINSNGTVVAIGLNNSINFYKFSGEVWFNYTENIIESVNIGTSISLNSDGSIICCYSPFALLNNTFVPDSIRVYSLYNNSSWRIYGNVISLTQSSIFTNIRSTLAMNMNGDKIIIGSPYSVEVTQNKGIVKVYNTISNENTPPPTTPAPYSWDKTGDIINNGGSDIDISSNGNFITLSDNVYSNLYDQDGKVVVYAYNGYNWSQIGESLYGNGEGALFGKSVGLNKNGNILVVGAPNPDGFGYVSTYEWNGSSWSKRALDLYGGLMNRFGWSISLNSDANTLAIGSPWSDANGIDSGHVGIYRWSTQNLRWDKLGQDINGESSYDYCGYRVSINSIGTRVAIASPYNDANGIDSGRVRIYNFNDSSQLWEQIGQNIDGYVGGDFNGFDIALNYDGNIIIIGAFGFGEREGLARVFKYNSSTLIWEQMGQDLTSGINQSVFGYSVAINYSGDTIIIGRPTQYFSGIVSGRATIFKWDGTDSWYEFESIYGDLNNDNTGVSVSITEDGKTVAASSDYGVSGRVQIYKANYPTTPPPINPELPDYAIQKYGAFPLGDTMVGDKENLYFGGLLKLNGNGDVLAIPSENGIIILKYNTTSLNWERYGNEIIKGTDFTEGVTSLSFNQSGNILAVGFVEENKVIIYTINNNVWIKLGSNSIIIGNQDSEFGGDVSLNQSGNKLLLSNLRSIGPAFFEYDINTSTWVVKKYFPFSSTNAILNNDGDVALFSVNKRPEDARDRKVYLIYKKIANDWILLGNEIDDDDGRQGVDRRGLTINKTNDIIAVSDYYYDTRSIIQGFRSNDGKVTVYKLTNNEWKPHGQSLYGKTNDNFGKELKLNDDGNLLFISAPSDYESDPNKSGYVSVYRFNINIWEEVLKISKNISHAGGFNDLFGFSMSTDKFGKVLAVSAPGFDNGNLIDVGSVNVYSLIISNENTYNPSLNVQYSEDVPQNIKYSTALSLSSAIFYERLGNSIEGNSENNNSGWSVAINSTGSRIAIGNPNGDAILFNTRITPGFTQIYNWDGSNWRQLGNNIIGDFTNDKSGFDIALDSTGYRVVIGAPENNNNGIDTGSVRVYDWNFSTLSWVQMGQDLYGETDYEQFGYSVDINNSGDIIAVGSPSKDHNGGDDIGVVRTYKLSSFVNNNLTNNIWKQLGQDIIGEYAGDKSGSTVCLNSDGTILAIGAPFNDENEIDSGHTRVYSWDFNNEKWTQLGQDIDGESGQSGTSLALNAVGDILAIGAEFNSDNDEYDSYAGHVRIYKWNPDISLWIKIGKDIDGDIANERSGYSVSLNALGNIVAVGSPYFNDRVNGLIAGKASVYNWDYEILDWVKIKNDIIGSGKNSFCGSSVALNDNGNLLVVGSAYENKYRGNVNVYQSALTSIPIPEGITDIFTPITSTTTTISPTFLNKLGQNINGELFIDQSGYSISLNSNANYIAIGAPFNKMGGVEAGHCRIYRWNIPTSSWHKIGSDIDGKSAYERSGHSVSLNSDGTIVAIGAPGDIINNNIGLVRVYNWNGVNWQQKGSDVSDNIQKSNYGTSVSLNSSGNILAVGAPGYYLNNDPGTVRIYNWNDDEQKWIQIGQDIIGESSNDESGYSISLNSDGTIVAIGAPKNDDNGVWSGHVRIYNWNDNEQKWIQIGQDIIGESSNDYSGFSVSLNSYGNVLAIGSPYNNGRGENAGHTRIYKFNATNNRWIKLGQDINGKNPGDASGYSVSLNSYGNRVVIGSPFTNGDGKKNSGTVRMYRWNSTISDWVQLSIDIHGENPEDLSGWSVSSDSDGDVFAIGSIHRLLFDTGYVRIYQATTKENINEFTTTTTTTTTTTKKPEEISEDGYIPPTTKTPLIQPAQPANFTTVKAVEYKRTNISINPFYPLSDNIKIPETTTLPIETTPINTTENVETSTTQNLKINCTSNCNKLNY
jgi:hypothetical protein